MTLPRPSRRLLLAAAATTVAAATTAAFSVTPLLAASATTKSTPLLAQQKLILKSAKQVNLHNSMVRLPLHRGEYRGKTVWYILTESSDSVWQQTSTSTTPPSSPTWGSGAPRACRPSPSPHHGT